MPKLVLDDLPEELPVLVGELVLKGESVSERVKTLAEQKETELQAIENDLYRDSITLMRDGLKFADIEPDQTEPPPAWVEELGMDGALKKLRTAKYNLMAASAAPVGIKVAAQIFTGITKARATERAAPRSLNIAKVYMTVPAREYPEQESEKDK